MIKRNILIVFILIIIFILFAFFSTQETSDEFKKAFNYKNKSENIIVQEFDKNNNLIRNTSAKSWTIFKNKDNEIVNPVVKFFTNNSEIFADFAKTLIDKNMKFYGKVKIVQHNEQVHNLQTDSLIVNVANNNITSDKKVVYFSKAGRINSNGINISPKNNIIKFLKESNILLANKNRIYSKYIYLKKDKQSESIYSEYPTKFVSAHFTSTTDKGFSYINDTITLLGDVSIVDGSATITTKNVAIANNQYRAKKTKYHTKKVIITSDNLYLNDNSQIVELQGNVQGIYE